MCGNTAVEKALMRPAIGSKAKAEAVSAIVNEAPGRELEQKTRVAAEAPSDRSVERVKELWTALQNEVRAMRKKSDYVGPRFAEEARRVHYGESEKKGVYGEASREEVKALHEEGIMAVPMPALPEDQN
ncbi:hypothetical protein FP2506_05286 [Fulvimarina pelagi HTCC2506]|uniref:DUF1178 family protein n=1 Tax=Fulvimarina pelagi HTCC2506 TaxID=314231 RepID=Q0G7Y9_9HYPH|nr:hypothetical protein FP2506_05286 [Fulvimarina pelagi HTCC2506]